LKSHIFWIAASLTRLAMTQRVLGFVIASVCKTRGNPDFSMAMAFAAVLKEQG
jgi:hypothetical protein